MLVVSLIIGFILLLVVFLIACIAGRVENPDADKFMKARYAHRGLHNGADRPENSLAAFRAAVEHGYGIELDVHLMNDGRLAVIHDSSLKRTAGADAKIENITRADLDNYRLLGTDQKIPTFKEVLDTVDGKVPLLIELKSAGNAKPLCSALWYELDGYKGDWCIESFDPRCVLWFKKNRPEVVRGQLSHNFLKHKENLIFPLRLLLTLLSFNIATQPDFVAFSFADRKLISNRLSKGFWNMKGFAWTLKSEEDIKTAESEGYAVIFEE